MKILKLPSLLFVLGAIPSLVGAEEISLIWDASVPSASVAGYEIRYGETPGTNATVLDVGNVLTRRITGLGAGKTYYFRARAYNAGKTTFSDDSNELQHVFVITLTAPVNLRIVAP